MREQHPILEELKEIFRQAKRATSEKERLRLRREGLRKMAAAPKRYFWPGVKPLYHHDPLYPEAVQTAWEYITCKIYGQLGCGDIYDPDTGNASPITLWNKRCKGAYFDLLRNKKKEQKLINPNPIDSRTGEPLNIDDVAQAPPPPEPSPEKIIRQAREIIQKDAEGIYRNKFVRETPPPPITAQEVLLEIFERVSRGEKWTNKILAEHFNVPPGTMNAAWSRNLRGLLRDIGNILREEM